MEFIPLLSAQATGLLLSSIDGDVADINGRAMKRTQGDFQT